MAKKGQNIQTSVISAAVGASIGAVAVALANKENRDKATSALKDAKKQAVKSANDLYKSVVPEAKKAKAIVKKTPVKKVTVKKVVTKNK